MLSLPPELLNVINLSMAFPHADPDMPQHINVGWERQTSSSYSWRGLERPDGPTGIFQYTLAGRGVLERHGVRHELEPGQAFLVIIPDDHHYYLPDGWEPWEFVYMCFGGADALRQANLIIDQHGSVLSLPLDHTAIILYQQLFHGVHTQQVPDAETLAESLYRFMLALRRSVNQHRRAFHPAITLAIQYIASQYDREIGVNDMAGVAGLSRAHFCRLFRLEMGKSPLEYLTGVRLERALCLLRATRLPLDEIASLCGFSNAGYFGKVFRKAYGITPVSYRHGATSTLLPDNLPVS